MEKINLQHVGEIRKECIDKQVDIHNQLVLEVLSFLETLTEEERFQNTDFDIKITCDSSDFGPKKELKVKIDTQKVNSFTDNSMFTTHSSKLEIIKKNKKG